MGALWDPFFRMYLTIESLPFLMIDKIGTQSVGRRRKKFIFNKIICQNVLAPFLGALRTSSFE